jgi:hypothetical protein
MKLKEKIDLNEKLKPYGIKPKIRDAEEFEIMFDDLNEDAKKRLLDFYNLETPEEGNLDVMPIIILMQEEE